MSGLTTSVSSFQRSNEALGDSNEPPGQSTNPHGAIPEQLGSTVGTAARSLESPGYDIDDYLHEIKAEECSSPPNSVAATYVSFGNDGTTATVTAMGQLMQMTSFLGKGRSGFFCVDGPHTPEPSYVMKRAQKLMELSNQKGPIGLELDPGEYASENMRSLCAKKPDLEFIRDRWPLFTSQNERLRSTRQYFVHDSTVWDVWTFATKYECQPVPEIKSMRFNAKLLIRELDFVDSGHSFNAETAYKACGPHGKACNSIVLRHDGMNFKNINSVISLVVSFFVDGEPQEIKKEGNAIFSIRGQEGSPGSRTLTFATAYKLHSSSSFNIRDTPTPFHCRFQDTLKDPYAVLSFSSDPHLDFVIRRTLEHILSVCSIPVLSHNGGTGKMVALTCGDKSGHRLVNKASFFAFQFLLLVYRFLGETNNEGHAEFRDYLKGRIERTCRAHLEWLFSNLAEKADHRFITNYWATGKGIKRRGTQQNQNAQRNESTDSYRTLGDESLANTPLQIIKLADFIDTIKSDDQWLRESFGALKAVVHSWIESLKKGDKRGFTAFPRPEANEYRLRDHVWIWRALKALEKLGYGYLLRIHEVDFQPHREGTKAQTMQPDSQDRSCPTRDYSPAAVQNKVLQRFTTENPSSKQRMIAVARTSASTRFMIHSRDSALFLNDGFFSKARSLWNMTLSAQQFHQENEDSFWSNPLQYAIGLLVAEKGFQINSKSPNEMFDESSRVLRDCISKNGLFTGKINDVTKEPELFLDETWRDFYWHVGFEVPFILLNLHRSSNFSFEPRTWDQMKQPTNADKPLIQLGYDGATGQYRDSILDKGKPDMKRFLPFNTLIDQSSITEIADEWLYPYPDFLDFNPKIKHRFAEPETLGKCGLETGEFITKAIESFKRRRQLRDSKDLRGIIVDIPKAVRSWIYVYSKST
ncbi:Mg2+ transporter protein CorA-like/Zinc transport protein ZntB [Lasiodiplodia theobromae]|uniref:Mg2+ transporter protein CorA-like/Zinc transport protein ZntB n=1 Tax=Lasiodiplodia theobromae TaxID=45133 RepID=UPI0015C36136|nr:Mg2+ transporter protein CorA-like/Zinc transport protein ZntB [Lasiodiplodia theobromae]KAF4537813.1 Mg2+ transporter protein CorA-like/Zinc transport protein ZntB [Lasiodiplodia theobromae]